MQRSQHLWVLGLEMVDCSPSSLCSFVAHGGGKAYCKQLVLLLVSQLLYSSCDITKVVNIKCVHPSCTSGTVQLKF